MNDLNLTDRQVSYLQMLADGLQMKAISVASGATEWSVKRQFVLIREKMEADSSTHAVAIALRRYIID